MKLVIVGLGTQGTKRYKLLKKYTVATVDPVNTKADYKTINDVPLDDYNAVFVCTPDSKKLDIINFCVKYLKHILIEKPLYFNNVKILKNLNKQIQEKKIVLYVAYNHRFEPNLIKVKKYIDKNKLGKIYSCKIFYGNGTARLVKNSVWRDNGDGVLSDLGSHLIDLIFYWFNNYNMKFRKVSFSKFENKSYDNAFIMSDNTNIKFFIDMSLTSWKNNFSCEIVGEKGSVHVNGLCKWSDSIMSFRKRVFPSGVPKEKKFIVSKGDPTWELEHKFFFNIVKKRKILDLNEQINNYKIIKNLK